MRTSNEFDRVFRQGRMYSSARMMVFVERSDSTKLGFAASRKLGSAPSRNRAKRKLRELVRDHSERIPTGRHLVMLAKPGFDRRRYGELAEEFLGLLTQIRRTS